MREAIMEAAARVSKQVGYENAGTCEFLLDSDGKSFYFLEMNTRLQVEHPVTELVTGIDLVKSQLLVAAGEPLDYDQGDIGLKGHAIECRVNAENPAKNFMPAPGTIGEYHEPAGPGVRVDSGTEPHAVIPQAYDPLVSKLITYGADRDEARRRMVRALTEYEIEGIKTTIPFHILMLNDERFVTGDYHTGTVEREMDLSVLKEAPVRKPKVGEPEVVERALLRRGQRKTLRREGEGETRHVRETTQAEAAEVERCRRGRRKRNADRPHAGNDREGARQRGPGGGGGRGRCRARGDEDGELDPRPRRRQGRVDQGRAGPVRPRRRPDSNNSLVLNQLLNK